MLSPPSSSQLLYSVRPPLKLKATLPLMPTVPSSCPLWLLTPGVSVASWVKLRPFNSNCEICLPVMTPDKLRRLRFHLPNLRAFDGHFGGLATYLKRGIGTGFLRDPQNDAFGLIVLEARSADGQVVAARRKGAHEIFAVAVGLGNAVDPTFGTAHRDLRLHNVGAAGIVHRAGDLTGLLGGCQSRQPVMQVRNVQRADFMMDPQKGKETIRPDRLRGLKHLVEPGTEYAFRIRLMTLDRCLRHKQQTANLLSY